MQNITHFFLQKHVLLRLRPFLGSSQGQFGNLSNFFCVFLVRWTTLWHFTHFSWLCKTNLFLQVRSSAVLSVLVSLHFEKIVHEVNFFCRAVQFSVQFSLHYLVQYISMQCIVTFNVQLNAVQCSVHLILVKHPNQTKKCTFTFISFHVWAVPEDENGFRKKIYLKLFIVTVVKKSIGAF